MTYAEAFQHITDQSVRSEAIKNTMGYYDDIPKKVGNLGEAIKWAFIWGGTAQGHEYWQAIYHELKHIAI